MTVYLDFIFLENLIINYIILLATGIVIKNRIKHKRLIISSLIGTIYAVITYINLFKIENSLLLKIILSIIMISLAYKPNKIKNLIKDLMIFYLTTFVFGGVTLYFIYSFSKAGIVISTIYYLKVLLFAVIIGFVLICVSFKLLKNGLNRKNMICEIEIFFNGKKKRIRAIIDSGNLLKDPISKIPVVVIEKEELRGIIPERILDNIEMILNGTNQEINDEIDRESTKIRILPFSSIGKENGLLLGIKADSLNIFIDNETIKVNEVIIGLYSKQISKAKEYSGLIGLELIEGGVHI